MAEDTKPERPTRKRSRFGCHNCKRLKIKCDEKKPSCSYCIKTKASCDYTIKLTWGGRPYTKPKALKNDYTTLKFDSNENVNTNDIFKIENPGAVLYSESNAKTTKRLSPTSNSIPTSIPMSKSKTFPVPTKRSPSFALMDPINKRVKIDPEVLQHQTDTIFLQNQVPQLQRIQSDVYTEFQFHKHPKSRSPSVRNLSPGESLMPVNLNEELKQFEEKIPESLVHSGLIEDLPPLDPEIMPGIGDGISSLSHALQDIAGDAFNLATLGIFNDVLLPINEIHSRSQTPRATAMELSGSEDSSKGEQMQNSFTSDEINDIDSYASDLSKIENYLPKKQASNFLNEFGSPLSFLTFSPHAPSPSNAIDELDEDEIEEENGLDGGFKIQEYSAALSITSPSASSTYSASSSNSSNSAKSSVPYSLLPLPELLLQVPYYRELFHFYCNVTSNYFVPAPSHIYKENPFKVILPRMAMGAPSILTTILAFAASNQAIVRNEESPKAIIDQLLGRTCNELIKSLHDTQESTSDSTLATVLMLSSYEVISTLNFARHRTHTLGARQIILTRGLCKPLAQGNNNGKKVNKRSLNVRISSESDISFFLVRWFAYIDVMGALSATKNASDYLTLDNPHGDGQLDYDFNDTEDDFDEDEFDTKADIDHLMGFDIRLLPHLAKIALLIKETNTYLETNSGTNLLPIDTVTKAMEIKEQLMNCYDRGEKRREARLTKIIEIKSNSDERRSSPTSPTESIKQDYVLRATNKIFCYMGLISLYRRVLQTRKESPIIQNLCKEIGEAFMRHIEPDSTAEVCTVFGLFCAGCEVMEPELRLYFYNRFKKMNETGSFNRFKGLDLMQECWDSGRTWWDIANEKDIDFILL